MDKKEVGLDASSLVTDEDALITFSTSDQPENLLGRLQETKSAPVPGNSSNSNGNKVTQWILPRRVLSYSKMLAATFSAPDETSIDLLPIPTCAARWIVEYLQHQLTKKPDQPPLLLEPRPIKSLHMKRICGQDHAWEAEFVEKMLREGRVPLLRKVLSAAHWLDIPTLVNLISARIAILVCLATCTQQLRRWLTGELPVPSQPLFDEDDETRTRYSMPRVA